MKIFLGLLATLMFSASVAMADYTLIVPQKPGQGTAVWADIVATNLSKYLDEPVVVRHIPGARDIPGFNKFHNELRFDDKTIMVAHGGNGVAYLLDDVDYDYKDYELIGLMNLDIVVGKRVDKDVKSAKWRIAGSAGYEPDGMAVAMLICGPQPGNKIDAYLDCWKQRTVWVNGLGGGERRMGFIRGEYDITRESPAAWIKFYTNNAENSVGNEIWFTHGTLNWNTGEQMPDHNFPGTQFEDVYERTWGERPSGEMYNAYRLTRNWRDVIQKSMWVNKGNPNKTKIVLAMRAMLNNPEDVARIETKTGKYEWVLGFGDTGRRVLDMLQDLITERALRGAVKWNQEAYGFDSIFKENLVVHQ